MKKVTLVPMIDYSDQAQSMSHLMSDPNMVLDWYTPTQAAEYFGVSDQSIYYWIRWGWIKAEKHMVGKKNCVRYFIHVTTIEEIDRKGREIVHTKLARRLYPRLVYQYESGRSMK